MANNISLCVTEDCNLRCRYCYIVHKNQFKKMSFEVAKKSVDYFLSERNIYDEKSVVWDFIGGEPFLEIDLIDKISDYIKKQMYLTKHPWFDDYMFSFSSNGLLYGTPEVQDYIKKNRKHISIGLSVDGNKIKHDMQRIYPDGSGSYDDVAKNINLWRSQFPHHGTKATFSHDDLPYLKDSIIHLWNIGIKEIAANIVFEDVWDEKDPVIFEEQLKELADYVIENDIYTKKEYTVRFFDPATGLPISPIKGKSRFCGSGKMVFVDCDGNFFPCIRFADYSLQKRNGWKIGDINSGVSLDKIKSFDKVCINRISTQECLDCKVASNCTSCTGFCYDDTGSILKRTTYNCEMHKANVRAIEYFWDKLAKKVNLDQKNNPREQEREINNKSFSKYLIIYTDDQATPHCSYINNKNRTNKMSDELIKKSIKFSLDRHFTPVIIGKTNLEYMHILDNKSDVTKTSDILVHDNKVLSSRGQNDRKVPIHILHVDKDNILNIMKFVMALVQNYSAVRINIILQNIDHFSDSDLQNYKNQLEILAKYILESDNLQVNVLNGIPAKTDSVNGCGSGVNTYTVAPNGKLYICAGFYFDDQNSNNSNDSSIGDLDTGINFNYLDDLKIENSIECNRCNNFQCKRCLVLNKRTTNEFKVSPDVQCKIADLENKIGKKLREEMAKRLENSQQGAC